MAQSALTVTPPNPTPPTNQACSGATGPNPPNFSKTHYAEPFGARTGDPRTGPFVDETPPGVRVNPNPPPHSIIVPTSGSLVAFATNLAALAGGSGASAGGTEGSYPGAAAGAVPASTSVAHEGAGTEQVVTKTYLAADADDAAHYPLQVVASVGPNATQATREAGPNASHPSYLSAGTAPAITGLSAGGVSGAGTTLLTVTGTGFTRASEVYIDGVKQTTNYASATSLSVTNAPKKATAGTVPVTVINGVGGTPSAPSNWTFT